MSEKTEKIVYSLRDKFLSLEKEKRISGRQLFTRTFASLLILWFLTMLIIFPILNSILWWFSISYVYTMQLSYAIIYYAIVFWLVPKLIVKRCHDFNNDWVITRNVFLGIFVIYVLITLYLIADLSFIDSFLNVIVILWGLSKIWLIVLWLYLIFRPWTKWKNDYWDDTTNVKLGFLW